MLPLPLHLSSSFNLNAWEFVRLTKLRICYTIPNVNRQRFSAVISGEHTHSDNKNNIATELIPKCDNRLFWFSTNFFFSRFIANQMARCTLVSSNQASVLCVISIFCLTVILWSFTLNETNQINLNDILLISFTAHHEFQTVLLTKKRSEWSVGL